MRKNKLLAVSFAVLLSLLIPYISATVPQTLNIQGKLTYPNGSSITANNYNFSFSIYTGSSGGTPLWQENHTLNVSKGIYDAVLGLTTPLTLDFNGNYYLGIKVNSDQEMTPRINLTSTPYSYRTIMAENLTCTDCLGQTQIQDIYILNTGDTMAGDLNMGGNSIHNAASLNATGLYIGGGFGDGDGGLTIQSNGNIFTDGSLTFSGDTYTANGQDINGSIVPFFNDIFSLGNSSNNWLNIYGTNIYEGGSLLSSKYLAKTGDTATGNYTFDSGTLFVDSVQDRVGIGTTSPQNKLNVIGDINATANISTPKLCLNGDCQTAWPSVSASSGWNDTGTQVQLITSTDNVSANALFVDNAQGMVGVNTTTPNQALQVRGNVNVSDGGGTGTIYVQGNLVGIGNTGELGGQQSSWGWVDDGSMVILADSNDSVGIGTSSPYQKLDVIGNVNVTGTAYAGNVTTPVLCLNGDCKSAWPSGSGTSPWTNDTNYIYIAASYPTSVNVTGTLYASNVSSFSPLQLQTGGTTRVYINDTNGNVGIGTTSPNALLDLQSSTQNLSRINLGGKEFYTGSTSGANGVALLLGVNRNANKQLWIADSELLNQNSTNPVIRLLIGSSPSIGAIATDGLTYLNLSLGNNNLFLQSNGNVGIGTTGPSGKLSVGDDIGLTTAGGNYINIGNTSSNVRLNVGQSSTNHLQFAWVYNAVPASAYSQIVTYGYNNPLRIDASNISLQSASGGNVGIGTTGPGAKLHVYAAEAVGTNLVLSNIQSVPTNGGGSVISRITGNGYTSDFEQNAAGNGPFRYGTYVDTNIVNSYVAAGGLYGNINFVTNGAIAMTVGGGTQAGKVGIGTTSPTANEVYNRLTIAATDNTALSFGVENAGTGQSALVIRRMGGTAARWYQYIPAGSTDLRFYSGSDLVTLQSGGNVGIGVTDPGYKLTVAYGGAKADTHAIETVSNIGGSTDAAATSMGLFTRQKRDATAGNRWAGLTAYDNGVGGIPLILQDLGGNVGIGTLAPASKLSVGGAGSSSYAIYGTGASYGAYGSGTSYGIYGSGGTYGVYGSGTNTGVEAVGGTNGVEASGTSYGVSGSGGLYGVYGYGTSYGVWGAGVTGGYGGHFTGTYGVEAVGGTYGVSASGTSYGVYGSGGTYGVYGTGTSKGVEGSSSATAVYGSGGTTGVYGSGSSKGVEGVGGTYGVYGTGTTGVYGSGTTGVYGVGGIYGYGGRFEANGGTYAIYIPASSGTAYCGTASCWADSSDRALKRDIQNIDYGLSQIMALQPVRFTFIADNSSNIGFIAQDVEKIIPEIVNGEEGAKGIAYGSLTPVLAKAIQEQQGQIEGHGSEIEQLRTENLEQQKQIDALRAIVCTDHPEAGICK